jgi:hypothetical protein
VIEEEGEEIRTGFEGHNFFRQFGFVHVYPCSLLASIRARCSGLGRGRWVRRPVGSVSESPRWKITDEGKGVGTIGSNGSSVVRPATH